MPALNNAWNEFDFTTITTLFAHPGCFSDSGSSFDPKFASQKIYLWIFKTANNGVPTASFDNVNGYGIFSCSRDNWIFPLGTSVPPNNSTTIVSDDVNQAYFGSFDALHLNLQPVPEPGTWVLVVLAALGVVGGRRRMLDLKSEAQEFYLS